MTSEAAVHSQATQLCSRLPHLRIWRMVQTRSRQSRMAARAWQTYRCDNSKFELDGDLITLHSDPSRPRLLFARAWLLFVCCRLRRSRWTNVRPRSECQLHLKVSALMCWVTQGVSRVRSSSQQLCERPLAQLLRLSEILTLIQLLLRRTTPIDGK